MMKMIVSLDEMKGYLNVTDSSQDEFLEMQIKVVSDAIEKYCRRIFNATDYVQTFYNGTLLATGKLELYQFPLIEITSVNTDADILDPLSYLVHKPTATILRSSGSFFAGGVETKVTYRAGYEDADMPPVLKAAVFDLVGERFNKKNSGVNLSFGSDVQRVSIPGAISIDFDYSLNNNDRKNSFGLILGSQLNVLDYFRSERAIVSGTGKLEFVEEV